jgi:hypothetical protein
MISVNIFSVDIKTNISILQSPIQVGFWNFSNFSSKFDSAVFCPSLVLVWNLIKVYAILRLSNKIFVMIYLYVRIL